MHVTIQLNLTQPQNKCTSPICSPYSPQGRPSDWLRLHFFIYISRALEVMLQIVDSIQEHPSKNNIMDFICVWQTLMAANSK